MSRPNHIWRRKSKTGEPGHWYVTRGKKKILVADRGKSRKEANEIYCASYSAPDPKHVGVQLILDRFLAHTLKNREMSTYRNYRRLLTSFSETITARLAVPRLKRYQLQEWLDGEDEWTDNTKNTAVRTLKAAFNWAVDMELIEANPIARFKPPRRTGRELFLDDAQFAALLKLVEDDGFTYYLTFAFQTGARPQETKIVAAKHFDGTKLTIPRKDAKGKQSPRTIYLNPTMQKLVAGLAKLYPSGPLFRNEDGNPWTPSAVRLRFRRSAKKKGQPKIGLAQKMGMVGLCAYTMRHSFCTNALIRGVDVLTVAQLMGHKDATMVMRVYQHLAKNHAYLLKAATAASAETVVPSLLVDFGIDPTAAASPLSVV